MANYEPVTGCLCGTLLIDNTDDRQDRNTLQKLQSQSSHHSLTFGIPAETFSSSFKVLSNISHPLTESYTFNQSVVKML